MASYKSVPLFVKEVTKAIFDGDHGKSMIGLSGFRSALNIARFRLTQYGFLSGGSEVGPANAVRMTAKGAERNRTAPSSVPWFDSMADQLDALEGGGSEGKDLTTVADPQHPTKPVPSTEAPATEPVQTYSPPAARNNRAPRARFARTRRARKA